ncbi:hypothetical protein HY251_16900 [bacterium]|nr:hypothetical protein [bacterium]
MGKPPAKVHRDDLRAGKTVKSGKHHTFQLTAPKGEINVVVRDHVGHDAVSEVAYEISGPHDVSFAGKTGKDGSIHLPGKNVPIDVYDLKLPDISDQTFHIEAFPAGHAPTIVRVPGWPKTVSGTLPKADVVADAACWCLGSLRAQDDGEIEKHLKQGISGDDVEALQEHLSKFGFKIELSTSKSGKPEDSDDLKNHKWDKFTTRAVRMFASHPKVGGDPEMIIKADGTAITCEIAEKIREWCFEGTVSPKDYWELPQLELKGDEVDAFGADQKGKATNDQTALHDYIKQIQDDLAKTGFAVHKDSICEIGKDHKATGIYSVAKASGGKHPDKELKDMSFLVKKLQRQSKWLWRMKTDGTHLADVGPGDKSVYGGDADGVMNALTADVLHEWADKGYHMVLKKFELKELHWPPESGTPIALDPGGGAAKLRSDAYDAWLEAAKDIYAQGGTIEGAYSSSPRGWKGGKNSSAKGNSAYSWHYSGLAVDVSQSPYAGDGTIGGSKFRYMLVEETDRFRIWCWADPQDPAPADPADDAADPVKQYRNRNIKTKHVEGTAGEAKKAGAPTDPNPLYGATTKKNAAGTDVESVAGKEGWYVDVSSILEDNKMMRIKRHSDWLTNAKGWEWWHYQFEPDPPPGADEDLVFGDYLQLYGVHEYRLRNASDGWPNHEDIDHAPG